MNTSPENQDINPLRENLLTLLNYPPLRTVLNSNGKVLDVTKLTDEEVMTMGKLIGAMVKNSIEDAAATEKAVTELINLAENAFKQKEPTVTPQPVG